MKRGVAIALLVAWVVPAWAKGEEDEQEQGSDSADDEATDDEGSAPKSKGKEATKEEPDTTDQALPPKQDLNGHDLGTKKRDNEFEHDRFFVDKIDTEKTEEGTLVQGSIASSTFFYTESGGAYPNVTAGNDTGPSRLFTELRLQTDFRHISASRWDARVDTRVRFVNTPTNDNSATTLPTPTNHIQSGLTGQNEYELRELWLVRNGKRSDFFFGRQFIPDLGGVKIDGLRLDYAQSAKFTVISFAGLYPLRGSRSLTTDYPPLKAADGTPAGRFVGIGGGGVAYRTINSYGALGGVAEVPLQKEQARVYATSNGYYRSGPTVDFYHLLLIDLVGAAAASSSAHVKFTNVSAGVNIKPNQRLRLTASFHRVDTETLNVQAGAFLNSIDTQAGGNPVVQNEAYIIRLATNMARAGVSAGLGKQQRFEISTAATYRNRPGFTLTTPSTMDTDIAVPAASSIEVWGGVVDRHFFGEARVGIDVSQSFGIGQLAYQRSVADMYRLFVNRLIQDGRGEWEGELSYSNIKDSVLGMTGTTGCGAGVMGPLVVDCYGTSSNSILSATGQLFYRIKQDWFGIGNLSVMRITNRRSDQIDDPAVLGFTGFVRIAKRF